MCRVRNSKDSMLVVEMDWNKSLVSKHDEPIGGLLGLDYFIHATVEQLDISFLITSDICGDVRRDNSHNEAPG